MRHEPPRFAPSNVSDEGSDIGETSVRRPCKITAMQATVTQRYTFLFVVLFVVGCGLEGSGGPEILGSNPSSDAEDAGGQGIDDGGTSWGAEVGVPDFGRDEPDGPIDAGSRRDVGAPEPDAGAVSTDTGSTSTPDVAMPEDLGPMPVCGDGKIEGSEACDDGNRSAGDGCSRNCAVETGYVCAASPSRCSPAPSPGSGDGKCEPTYGSDVYDPFPGGHGQYPRGDSDTYGWRGEDFESYSDGELVEASSGKSRRSHLEVTSGVLQARHVNGSQVYRRGWTDTYNFRVLSRATSGGAKVRFTDVSNRARVHLKAWHANVSATSGAHLFARYQTENDLYVASLRNDGKVTIKRKHCDIYTTLKSAPFSQGPVQTGKWYSLRFDVEGQRLRFYVDGNLELEAFDGELSWGTTGIRTDKADIYIDDWEHR